MMMILNVVARKKIRRDLGVAEKVMEAPNESHIEMTTMTAAVMTKTATIENGKNANDPKAVPRNAVAKVRNENMTKMMTTTMMMIAAAAAVVVIVPDHHNERNDGAKNVIAARNENKRNHPNEKRRNGAENVTMTLIMIPMMTLKLDGV